MNTFLVALVVVLIIAAIVTTMVEKYRKYTIAIIPFIIICVILIIKKMYAPKQKVTTEFDNAIKTVKQDMHEADVVAEMKMKVAKEKNVEKQNQIKEITKISNKMDRRQKLVEMAKNEGINTDFSNI